ncbi:hypothetical protein A8C56_10955 [Niabella ginsenosidivorans]|uniref:SusC/RagA family TonB-linked outer membrane protein n=1 Tax=Niabella ginsenosidivorans TaxID=1176587 RepID=A0A1A9I3Z4_9BACT|nr:TonB-dependent receptor [Niabella ginsenosidivorans]ANH81430.1 hypothetical protein A8C56_10955 [Niabella ginsenosidivorans]
MKRVLCFLIVLTTLTPFYSKGQNEPQPTINSVLKGQVSDSASKLPLANVSIQIKGITNGTTSDARGAFTLYTAQKFPFTIVVTSVGYEAKETVATGSPIDVFLKPATSQLEDVVVVGYGTQRRKDVIGAVSKVNAQEVKTFPAASFDAQLQGKAAGVQINTFSGTPGAGIKVQIRGTASINASNAPLYVIDGLIVNNNSLSSIDLGGGKVTSPLADLNPADIESIEILKDASAIAIYGSRGSNGVILVTTNKGAYSQNRAQINLSASHGYQWADKSRLWKYTTGPEHAMLVNEQWINSGIDNPALNQTYENRPFRPVDEVINGVPGRGNPEDQQTYDRLAIGLRTAQNNDYHLSIQKGNESTRYNLALGYTDQEGIMKPVKFDRYSFRYNLESKLNKFITIGSLNNLSYSFRQQAREGSGQQASYTLAIMHTPTYLPLYNDDGTLARGSIYENIYNLIDLNTTNISTRSIRYSGNQYLEVKILPELNFRATFGLDYDYYNDREFFSDKTIIGGAPNPLGYKYEGITNYSLLQSEQLFNYNKSFGSGHTITALLGSSFQQEDSKFTSATGQGFPNNSFQQISAASVRTATQSQSRSTLASFLSRINYNFDNTYYVEASLRADGSSKFGANNRWGYFPAVGFGWRVKNAAFLKNTDRISELKLRLSAGSSGNQNGINDYASRGLWTGNAQYADDLTSGFKAGIAPSQLANPNLKWEKTTSYNLGLNIGFFDNRLNFDVDFYYRYTTDALLQLQVPGATGYNSMLANAGEISNRGIEVAVSSLNIKNAAFQWRTDFNIASNRNRAEKLLAPITFEAREYRRTEEGYPLASWWLYEQLYVDPQTGNAVFYDADHNGTLTATDRRMLGNLIPKFFGGLTNNFSFGNFDANILFTFQYGNRVYNFNRYIMEGGGTRDASRAILASQLKRWQKPGDITDVPRVTSVGYNYTIEQNSRFLEDGSFIRLKAVSLGYNLSNSLTNRLGLRGVRVFASGSNLLIWTKYTGADPESSNDAGQNLDGLDTATLPQPVGISFGINVKF